MLSDAKARLEYYLSRTPWRPFGVRLVNGMTYWFETEKRCGHGKNYLLFLDDDDFVEILPDQITEIINGTAPEEST